jgi:hypothetical protein
LLVDGSVVAVFIYDTSEMKRNSLFICLRFRFAFFSFFFLCRKSFSSLLIKSLFQQIFQILLFCRCNHFENHQASLSFTMRAAKNNFH